MCCDINGHVSLCGKLTRNDADKDTHRLLLRWVSLTHRPSRKPQRQRPMYELNYLYSKLVLLFLHLVNLHNESGELIKQGPGEILRWGSTPVIS